LAHALFDHGFDEHVAGKQYVEFALGFLRGGERTLVLPMIASFALPRFLQLAHDQTLFGDLVKQCV
jgi:hypothetical protein